MAWMEEVGSPSICANCHSNTCDLANVLLSLWRILVCLLEGRLRVTLTESEKSQEL